MSIFIISMLRNGCVRECPGCAHRLKSMEESLLQKEEWLQQKLNPWINCFVPIRSVSSELRWYYRGKVCLNTHFLEGEWKFGMLHKDVLINIPECPIHTQKVRNSIELFKKVLPASVDFQMAFYFHMESQLTLVLKTKQMPETKWLTDSVKARLGEIGIDGLSIHLNPSAGRRLFEKWGWNLLYGKEYSNDTDGFRYGRTSFHQLIPELHTESLDESEHFFQPDASTAMVDLYCGRGISMARWIKYKCPVIGVETGGEAVSCARINVPEAQVYQGTCERRIPQLENWRELYSGHPQITRFCLYTNPPRTGMESLVLQWIVQKLKPFRIAYLSCSAGTLRRDLDVLFANNYEVKKIVPYDFFPQTFHVECLVLLEYNTGQKH